MKPEIESSNYIINQSLTVVFPEIFRTIFSPLQISETKKKRVGTRSIGISDRSGALKSIYESYVLKIL
jgi:hypothetical protein